MPVVACGIKKRIWKNRFKKIDYPWVFSTNFRIFGPAVWPTLAITYLYVTAHIHILWRIFKRIKLFESFLAETICQVYFAKLESTDLPSLFCKVGIHWFAKFILHGWNPLIWQVGSIYLHILFSRTLEATFQISLTNSL